MKKFLILAASSAVLLATPALANDHDDDGGWYLRANGGYGTHHDIDFNDDIFVGDIESEGGVAGSAGIGYDFGDSNWRLELDADQMFSDMGKVDQNVNSFAKLRTNTMMANAIYDFGGDSDYNDDGMNVVPYLGAGIGFVQGQLSAQAHDSVVTGGVRPQLLDNPGCLGALNGACSLKDTDTVFGYQGIAGVGVELANNLFWDTHYTYMKTAQDFTFDNAHFNPGAFNVRPGLRAFQHDTKVDAGAHTLVSGLRYKFGGADTPPPPPPPPVEVPQVVQPTTYTCWDNSTVVTDLANCPEVPQVQPTTYTCWDNSTVVTDVANCPAQPVAVEPTYYTCDDGSTTTDMAYCAPSAPVALQYNDCGPSNVAIFNVPVSSTPKQMPRLGTMPEFGDSHGLTPNQFYEKLQARYASSATDKAYLNYLFKSMGYSNGFRDAQSYMFSEEVLPVGTTGMLGLGKQHHYKYSVLPSNDRDRQAFRIQSANGSVIHFMKTCGNYMYACN